MKNKQRYVRVAAVLLSSDPACDPLDVTHYAQLHSKSRFVMTCLNLINGCFCLLPSFEPLLGTTSRARREMNGGLTKLVGIHSG